MEIPAIPEPSEPPAVEPAPVVGPRIAVIIPCYKVTRSIEAVIADIGDWAWGIWCVDDCCPEGSAEVIAALAKTNPRVHLVRRPQNGGVGAATMSGYSAAIEAGADILVKIDGDGQMDPRLVPALVRPIIEGKADYVKANRFFSAETIASMPSLRLIGNAGLSFFSKLSSGYWDLFDPTNGFTALEARVAAVLPFDKIHPRYFFESDLLFRLGVMRARVVELPQIAIYGDEESSLSELDALLTFPGLHARNFFKRIAYNYFLRGFSVASLNLLFGVLLGGFGTVFGSYHWIVAAQSGSAATAGTVMVAALPILVGLQLVLSFLATDISNTPREPMHPRLADIRILGSDLHG